nr:gustatory receptor 1 [Podabrus annulatus]
MNPNHLFEALNPMFLVSNLIGTSPIYIQDVNGKRNLKTSNVFQIITGLYLSTYTVSIIYGAENFEVDTTNKYFNNAMTIIGVALDVVGQIFLLYVIYLFTFFITKNIKKAISNIAIIDSILLDLGHTCNYKKTLWQTTAILVGGISVIAYTSIMHVIILPDHSPFSTNQALWFVFYFPNLTIFVMESQFAIVTHLIYQRFQAVNEILNKLSLQNDSEFNNNYSNFEIITVSSTTKPSRTKTTTIRKIETLMEVYDSTVDVASEINSSYSFQVLICLAILFIKLVFGINFAYLELFIYNKSSSSLSWIMWAIMNTFEILLIVIPCNITTMEAQKTGVEVHRLMMNSKESFIREKLLVFSQQIFHCPVEFSACGLFLIDAPLLFMIVSAVTTYLIIMLQFQEGTEANCIATNATNI